MENTQTSPWDDAPEWATMRYRNAYGAWVWTDDFSNPTHVQTASDRMFEHPALTIYDSAATIQLRPGGQDDAK